jgi:hypothetical protein
MRTINFANILGVILAAVTGLTLATSAVAQVDVKVFDSSKQAETRITIREGQLYNVTVKATTEKSVFTVVNPTDLGGDADVVAFDKDGNELDRTTIEFEAHSRRSFELESVFSDLDSAGIDYVQVSVSLRPRESTVTEARSLPIAFFSQLNPSWANDLVGASGRTIRQIGCAMTSVTMAAASKMTNVNPHTMNAYLSNPSVGGYTSSGSLYWAKPPNFQPTSGFRYIGSSVNGTSTLRSAAFLKSLIDGGNYVVASSTRFTQHWVVVYKYNGTGSSLSDFEYLDPADSSYVRRTVNDGRVTATSQIRVYK